MKYALIGFVLLIAATAATFYRYGSLDPCSWMEQDMAADSALPLLVIQAEIKARFLLDGITDPGFYECLEAWWELRGEDLPSD
jgi:hypothetical protein